ncbi:MAG TPA: hypothetical protein VMT29_19330 [Steroidobacteraceae bacterium]|nr:hypothetical protein [Steroidobacteraceae bacterium]
MSRNDKMLRTLFTALLLSTAAMGIIRAGEPPVPAQSSPATAPASPSGATTSSGPSGTSGAASRPGSTATPAPAAAPRAGAAGSGGAAAGAQGASAKTATFCFQFTLRCLERKSTTAAQGAGKRPLNLTAPDIRTVVPQEELQEPLPSADQQAQAEESDTVRVKGTPNTPDVPGGFGALWWALNHPTQAWRIFAPAE